MVRPKPKNTRRYTYTPAELAARWQVDVRTIWLALQRGELHGFKVARRDWRIPVRVVEEREAGTDRGTDDVALGAS